MISVVFGNLESGLITSIQERSDDSFRSGDYLYLDEGCKKINSNNFYKFYLSKDKSNNVILLEKQVIDITADKLTAKVGEVITITNKSKLKTIKLKIKNHDVEISRELKLSFSVAGNYQVYLPYTDENAKIYMEEFTLEVQDA